MLDMQILSGANKGLANPFGPNWAVLILPYIEQGALFTQANPSSYPGVSPVLPDKKGTVVPTQGFNLSWMAVGSTPVKIFQCPSDNYNQNPYLDPTNGPIGGPAAGWARGNYGVTAGYEDFDHVNGGASYTTSRNRYPAAKWDGCPARSCRRTLVPG